MERILIHLALTLLAFGFSASAVASDTLSLLKADLRADGRKIEAVRLLGDKTRFEVCGGDWCQTVVASGRKAYKESHAWDAAFLMFYYFDANEEYQARRADHAELLMHRYRKKCIRQESDQRAVAACALKALSDQFGFSYRRVQYDVGARCESVFVTRAPYFSGVGRCKPHRE